MPVDILLYALIAAGLVFWLRNVLGTRHGDERERPNPFTSAPAKITSDTPLRPAAIPAIEQDTELYAPALPRNTKIAGASVESGLSLVAQKDKTFDIVRFITGAQDAFVMIVEAFASGDRETLKDLLSESVYQSFDSALRTREASGETVATEIHAIRQAEITDAGLQGNDAHITVRFTAEETCVISDRDGRVLGGDPDRITEMVDIWTFSRNIKSRDPRWLLSETSDGDVIEDHKTPVPDAH